MDGSIETKDGTLLSDAKAAEGGGCVFCDLGLDTAQAGLGGGHYHEIVSKCGGRPTRHFIRCQVKS